MQRGLGGQLARDDADLAPDTREVLLIARCRRPLPGSRRGRSRRRLGRTARWSPADGNRGVSARRRIRTDRDDWAYIRGAPRSRGGIGHDRIHHDRAARWGSGHASQGLRWSGGRWRARIRDTPGSVRGRGIRPGGGGRWRRRGGTTADGGSAGICPRGRPRRRAAQSRRTDGARRPAAFRRPDGRRARITRVLAR